jgi:hypothetical protein
VNAPTHLKEMIIVMAIAGIVFRLAKPMALQFSSEADFVRRRNVWFGLTIAGFLSPTFWWFILGAFPLLTWAARKETNPVALYLLLMQVVPQSYVSIPLIGTNGLFDVDHYRLLSICVLLPAGYRTLKSSSRLSTPFFRTVDTLLLGWGVLYIAIFIPPDLPGHEILHDSLTNIIRRAVLFFLDVYLLYFVANRTCTSQRNIREAQAAFCLACGVMSLVGLFEFARHWLLYVDIAEQWSGNTDAGFYLMRGDLLRAQASAGHPLALGYLIAIAFGFWLHLKSHIQSRIRRNGTTFVLWAGLLAAYSRGPWIGAIVIYLAFSGFSPGGFKRFVRATCIVAFLACVILSTPLSDRIRNVLPFLGGTVDAGATVYRQRLAERTWELVQRAPLLGDQLAYSKMEDLRQGQGIIDLVNTYAEVVLFYGFIGLMLFLGFVLVVLVRTYSLSQLDGLLDPELARMGASLAACIVGTMLMLSSCSFIFGYAKMFYVLAGLAAAYVQLHRKVKFDFAKTLRNLSQ